MVRLRRSKSAAPALQEVPRPRRCAVVLSGGGHLGAVQAGMLRAFVEAGIEPDAYVGCSVGALNATVMAACPPDEAIERLEAAWRAMRTEDIFDGNSMRHAWKIARGHDHLYSNSGLIRLVTTIVPVTHFHHLRVPLRIVACDIETGEEHVFASGPLLRPLLATSALPGVFPPIRIGTNTYVDGGIVNNVPISHAAAADQVYVLAVRDEADDEAPTSSFGLLLRSFAISRAMRFQLDLERYRAETEIIVVPQPALPPVRFPDLSRSAELFDLGCDHARTFLESLRHADDLDVSAPAV